MRRSDRLLETGCSDGYALTEDRARDPSGAELIELLILFDEFRCMLGF